MIPYSIKKLSIALALAYSFVPAFTPIVVFAEVQQAKAPYSHVNSKGKKYFLFMKEVSLKNSDKIQRLYYFTKSPENKKGQPVAAVPTDRVVSETRNGLLVLKKK